MIEGLSRGGRRAAPERCWVLVGAVENGVWRVRRRQASRGGLASVEAAWEWALAREEALGDVAGFWHTHPRISGLAGPEGGLDPSARDIRTMQAWCSALGKPLICVISIGRAAQACLFQDSADCGVRLAGVEQVGRDGVIVR
jgi:hypothetical protein